MLQMVRICDDNEKSSVAAAVPFLPEEMMISTKLMTMTTIPSIAWLACRLQFFYLLLSLRFSSFLFICIRH